MHAKISYIKVGEEVVWKYKLIFHKVHSSTTTVATRFWKYFMQVRQRLGGGRKAQVLSKKICSGYLSLDSPLKLNSPFFVRAEERLLPRLKGGRGSISSRFKENLHS